MLKRTQPPLYSEESDLDMENYDTNQGHGESNYEETPTGYDLTLRKVVQQRPIAGMDQNMNAISGQAGQFRKLKFEGA
jgi:hypothetical protein